MTTTKVTDLSVGEALFPILVEALRRAEGDGDWAEAGRVRATARHLGADEWALVRAAREVDTLVTV